MIEIGETSDITALKSNPDLVNKLREGVCSVFLSDFASDGPMLWNENKAEFDAMVGKFWHILIFANPSLQDAQKRLKDIIFQDLKLLEIPPDKKSAGLLFFNPHQKIPKNSKAFWLPFDRNLIGDQRKTGTKLQQLFYMMDEILKQHSKKDGQWWVDENKTEQALKRLYGNFQKNGQACEMSGSLLATAERLAKAGAKEVGKAALSTLIMDPTLKGIAEIASTPIDFLLSLMAEIFRT